jgi:hypothetical protein
MSVAYDGEARSLIATRRKLREGGFSRPLAETVRSIFGQSRSVGTPDTKDCLW